MRNKSVFFIVMLALTIGIVSVAMAADNNYEVVYPNSRTVIPLQAPTPRLDTLAGKTICELWNDKFHGDKTFPIIEELLQEKYPGVNFVNYTQFGNTHAVTELQDVLLLPDKLQAAGCDAVISGNAC